MDTISFMIRENRARGEYIIDELAGVEGNNTQPGLLAPALPVKRIRFLLMESQTLRKYKRNNSQ